MKTSWISRKRKSPQDLNLISLRLISFTLSISALITIRLINIHVSAKFGIWGGNRVLNHFTQNVFHWCVLIVEQGVDDVSISQSFMSYIGIEMFNDVENYISLTRISLLNSLHRLSCKKVFPCFMTCWFPSELVSVITRMLIASMFTFTAFSPSSHIGFNLSWVLFHPIKKQSFLTPQTASPSPPNELEFIYLSDENSTKPHETSQ